MSKKWNCFLELLASLHVIRSTRRVCRRTVTCRWMDASNRWRNVWAFYVPLAEAMINFWATKEIPLQMSYLQESLRLFSSWSCILQPRIYFGRQLEQTCWLQVFFTVHCACQNNQHGKACQKHKKLLWMPIRAMGSLLHVLLAAANPISDISVQRVECCTWLGHLCRLRQEHSPRVWLYRIAKIMASKL